MTHIPDFAVHLSSAPDGGFAGTLRRHAALYQRWMRGDEEAGQQYQRELTSWKRGMAFITDQIAAEVRRIEQSNLRRRGFLSRMYRDQADEAVLAADHLDVEADGYVKQGNLEKAQEYRGKADKLRENAEELRAHATEVAPK